MPANPEPFEKFGEVICLALALEKRFIGLDAAQVVYALSLIQATYIVQAAEVNGEDPKALTEVVADQVRRYVGWLGTDMGELFKHFNAAIHSRQNRGPVC
jgi:hypothetical protein